LYQGRQWRRVAALGLAGTAAALTWTPWKAAAQQSATAPATNPSAVGVGYLFTTITGLNAAPIVHSEFAVSTYQLLSTQVRFSERNNEQKLNFAPGKLRTDPYACSWRCELTINLVRTESALTAGLAGAVNGTAPYTDRMRRIAAGIQDSLNQMPAMRPKNPGESDDDYAKYRAEYYRGLDAIVAQYLEQVTRQALIVTYGANVQTFGALGGTRVDLDTDQVVDNQYTFKGWNANFGLAYTPTPRVAFASTYYFTRKRGTSAAGQRLANYHGVSASAGVRIVELDRDYRASTAYLRSGFIPSLVIGATLEVQQCDGGPDACEKRTTREVAASPFLDVRVTPETQFRIGLPVRWSRVATKGSTELLPVAQIGFNLAGL